MDEHKGSTLVCRKSDKTEKILCILREKGTSKEWIYTSEAEMEHKNNKSLSIVNFLAEVFLPRGFPDSVHSDYLSYQIWDTIQAFTSTVLGTLTTHSIMIGVGVGESTATPLAAAISWILKDGMGMFGRIIFAWWSGPGLDAHCKKWRLFADVLCDLSLGIELALPYFPGYTTVLLCLSSGMKSLVGVAGGATRTSITEHQALKNNLADVAAKDGSQETCVNLIGSVVGVFMLSYLDASSNVIFWFAVLTTIHMYANYRAVRSLCFNTLNEDRLAILINNYLARQIILCPEVANTRESLSVFHRASKNLCGFDIVMGDSLKKFTDSAQLQNRSSLVLLKASSSHDLTGSIVVGSERSTNAPNFIIPDMKNRTICVALRHGAAPKDILKAYFSAFVHGIYLSIHLHLRPDIKLNAETCSGPLSRLREMAKESHEKQESDVVGTWIDKEAITWMQLLEDSEWRLDSNLLSIGSYRSYEKPSLDVYTKKEN